ncbi:MAG: winged helix DNA-binding domain-containing protein [Acidimicrobiia bacterium]
MSEVLSQRALNRALLARQLYLERADLSIPSALERIAGIQNQYAPAGYLGLWSRLAGFQRDDLTRALSDRSVIQGTLLRATIHLTSPGDFALMTAAVAEERKAWWLRATKTTNSKPIEKMAVEIAEALADGPRKRLQLQKQLGLDSTAWNGASLWLDLVRVPPSGTWEQRRADLYSLACDWVSGWDELRASTEGLAHSIKRYLGAFGPATRQDIASFLGLRPPLLQDTLSHLELRTFQDESGTALLDIPDGLLPDPVTPAPPRFVPVWDASLLVHARRTQILPERYRPTIFNTKTPHSHNTFLIDGQVAGTWKFEKSDISINPFEELSRKSARELDDERERLLEFHA